jgi:hypothetical protein
MAAGILLLAICAACLVATALAWSGRWNRWAQQVLGPLPITILPAAAAGSLAGGLAALGAISGTSPVAIACFVVMLVCFAMFFVTPRWWGPRWYRERDLDAPPDLGDPLSAMAMAGVRAAGPVAERPSRSVAPADLGPALKSWKGSWMVGDETAPAAHGLTHAGAVEGRLHLHRAGISFAASRVEDLLRDHPTVLAIDAAQLRDVRVVPRGAGVDGNPTQSHGPRSLFARLVLDTAGGPYLFEVQSARRTAGQIGEQLGVEIAS